MRFSVIIPAYNEEKALGKVLDDIKKAAALKNFDAEVIVVDDGSKDRTSEIAGSKGISVLRHEKNRGYGAALRTGILASKNETIAIIDGDGSYPPDEMFILMGNIGENEMVIGARIKKTPGCRF